MSVEPDGPLFRRDADPVHFDKQDDNAALRTFSAAAVDFNVRHHPDRLGTITVLFLFGEACDAYENREISHLERIKMVLRMKAFLDLWKCFLAKAGYSKSRHYLSSQADDIANILVNALLGLIYIHRDKLSGRHPLLPWLHASAMCEHVFGECRKLIKAFTYLDFLYMIPKLLALLRAANIFDYTTRAKARASGYAHTYFSTDDGLINLVLLSIFPSDAEIRTAAAAAWEEAKSLWFALGISPSDILPTADDAPPIVTLPGINSWFDSSSSFPGSNPTPVATNLSAATDPHSESEEDVTDDEVDEEIHAMQILEEVMAVEIDRGSAPLRPRKDEDQMAALLCAAAAIDAEKAQLLSVLLPFYGSNSDSTVFSQGKLC